MAVFVDDPRFVITVWYTNANGLQLKDDVQFRRKANLFNLSLIN